MKKTATFVGLVASCLFLVIFFGTNSLLAASSVPTGSLDCGSNNNTCVPTSGDACTSSANACGATAQGTVSCDGTCSASTPAVPANLNQSCSSSANSCGQTNSGTINCSGVCSATTPDNSSCGPTYGWSTGDWGVCSGGGTRTKSRTVVCKTNNGTGSVVDDSYCNAGSKPVVSQACSCTVYYGDSENYDSMHYSGPEQVHYTFTVPANAAPVGMQTVLGGVMQTCDKQPYNDAISAPYNPYFGKCVLMSLQTINQSTAPGGNPRMKITNTGTGQVVVDRTIPQWLTFPSLNVDFQETFEYLNLPQGTYQVDMYSTTLGYIYSTYSSGWVDFGNQYAGYWWQGSGNLAEVCS